MLFRSENFIHHGRADQGCVAAGVEGRRDFDHIAAAYIEPAHTTDQGLALDGRKPADFGSAGARRVDRIKPIDIDLLTQAARDCGCVMTAEEHQIRGGLGSAVAEVLATHAPVPMAFCGMDDEFGQSGDAWELIRHYGLDGPGLAASARTLVESKNA